MDTNAESTFALIEEVQKHLILYSDAFHFAKRRSEHIAAWVEVAKSLGDGVSFEKVKARWNYLRGSHARFLQLGYRMQIPGIHERLSFLDQYIRLKPHTKANVRDGLEYAIQLVNCVRQYPCLYDGSNASAKDTVWEQVAAKFRRGATAQSCMLRWRRMRNLYTYCMKKGHTVKPEGIAPYLEFLKPFIHLEPIEDENFYKAKQLADIVRQYPALYRGKKRVRKLAHWKEVARLMGNQTTVKMCITKWTWLRLKYERHLKIGFKMEPHGIERHLRFLNPYVRGKPCPLPDELPIRPIVDRRVEHLHVDEADPDVQVLLGFLNSMAEMSEPQKRLFRIGAVQASRSILG